MIFLYIALVVVFVLAIYFAVDGLRLNRAVQSLENENEALRHRVTELVAEVRRIGTASGLASAVVSAKDDELMPLRQNNRGAARPKPRAPEAPGTVVLASGDPSEVVRLTDALTGNGYHMVTASLAELPRYARELSTAAILIDLRDAPTLSGMSAFLGDAAQDPLAKEVPLFALVGTTLERERLIDDGSYTAAFVVPTDTALVAASLGAAIIRRKTRARRVEAGRLMAATSR